MANTQRPPHVTRRGLVKMAGAVAAVPHLIPPALAAEGSTLRLAFNAPVATLDPQKFRAGGIEYNYAMCVFSRLVTQDPQLQVQPDLATSWEASEDLKTWTFHLRPGVKFHNEKMFDAADVLFTLRQDPGQGGRLGPPGEF